MGLMWMTFKFLQPYVGPGLMLGYPLYSSIRAIESKYKEDDEQWLTYWVIYSFIALFELAAERVLELIPLWPAIKLIGICWLVLPQFRGACYVYRTYVRKIFRSLQADHERSTEHHEHYEHHEDFDEKQRKLLQMMSPEARTAVAQYISEHGADAFDTLINSASKHAVKSKSPKTPKTPKSPIRSLFERKHSPNSA